MKSLFCAIIATTFISLAHSSIDIVSVDTSFYPKIRLIISPVPSTMDVSDISIEENGRRQTAFFVSPVATCPDSLRITFLSAPRKTGYHRVTLRSPAWQASATYRAIHPRRIGMRRPGSVRLNIRTHADVTTVCRIIAKHRETGMILEALTTRDDLVEFLSSISEQQGKWTAEFRLASSDSYLTTKDFSVEPDRETVLDISLGTIVIPLRDTVRRNEYRVDILPEGVLHPSMSSCLSSLTYFNDDSLLLHLLPGVYRVAIRSNGFSEEAWRWNERVVVPPSELVVLESPWDD